MNSEIKKVLRKIEQNGYEAYIVGGFVRDCLLGIPSTDIDICTNMLPKDIIKIFLNAQKIGNYGTYNIKTNQFNYDISTYRIENNYENRHPKTIEYTSNLIEDLHRRDFTINAICMTQKGKIIDLLNGISDIEQKIIRLIGNPKKRLQEDPLRILRAIRFSSNLQFKIEDNLWKEMVNQKELILTLSMERIKKELDSILISPNFQTGFNLLYKAGITSLLGIKYDKIKYVSDVSGMWAQIKRTKDLKFSKNETKQIAIIQKILQTKQITPMTIFEVGLYPVSVAATILEIPKSQITKMYKKMPIYEPNDVKLTFSQIEEITKKTPKEIKQLQKEIIQKILEGTLKNKKEQLIKYIKKREEHYE